MALRNVYSNMMMFFLVLSIVCNLASLGMVMFFGRHLVGGTLVCAPPEDYSEYLHRQRVYKGNEGYLKGS